MISSARSRCALPPRPSARSARPSSWNAPVSSTPNTVLAMTATQGAAGTAGRSSNRPHNTTAVSPPTIQPTPGKCAALARSIAGLKPTQPARRPVTGMRVKNCRASRRWRKNWFMRSGVRSGWAIQYRSG